MENKKENCLVQEIQVHKGGWELRHPAVSYFNMKPDSSTQLIVD